MKELPEEDPVFGLRYDKRSILPDEMPKSGKTKRIEAHLLPEIIEALQKLADKENRSLKNYIETLLIKHVNELKKG